MTKAKSIRQLIGEAEEQILKAEKLGANPESKPIYCFVYDNAYYFKRKLREIKLQCKYFDKLPSRDGIPNAFRVLWRYFRTEGFEYAPTTLERAFSDYDCNSFELDMLKSLIITASLIQAGLICKGEHSVSLLQKTQSLMRSVEIRDFSSLYTKLSAAERLLSQKEENYMLMTDGTKALYRKALRSYSAKLGVSEKEGVLTAEKKAVGLGIPIGRVLGVDKKPFSAPYLLAVAAVFALLMWGVLALCPLWGAALLFAPLLSFAFGFADFAFSFIYTPKPCPAIASEKLPKGKKTLTVITTLLTDDGVFSRLERLYHTNKGEGIYFGILADLPSAKTQNQPSDKELIKKAIDGIESLKYRFGNHFCLFIRHRTDNGEGAFCGRERKRGAIEDLVRYLKGADAPFEYAVGADCRGVKFLLTLDGDTALPPDGASALTGMMMHPLNRPVAEKGRVRRGYGIIQPAVKPCLCAEGHTLFSSLLTGAGGIDVYESAAFNRQQSVFGEGIFCGKGIMDVDAYYTLLDGVLPSNRVLSHDMPEGNILRTRYVSDISFTDSVPSGVLAYYYRLHRWIRGDVQNMSLLFGYNQGLRGGIRIVMNVFRHLSAVLSVTVLFAAGFFATETAGLFLCLFALLNYISPLFYTLISRPKALRFRARRFFSSVKGGAVQSLRTVGFELCSLCYKALITADGFLKAIYRLIRGKKLLAWVTAAQAEKRGNGITAYIYGSFPSSLLGAFAFFATKLWVTRLLGLIWFLFPIFAFRLSCSVRKKQSVSLENRKAIRARALPIWRFFAENVNESTCFLPPDNIQLSPVEAVAYRTSPTNIGLYLLSVVAAEDFGFITEKESAERIDKTLSTVESLPKWNGHLYNWYALNPCRIIGGNYVSTVDSGNFCVCLVALSRYLYSGGRTTLARRAERIFEETDFKCLYNEERELFSLGVQTETEKVSDICYDLFMSEARSTSYFAVAMGQVPSRHWRSLGRPVVGSDGHIGMASWSGTAFEYFMPQLFLPIYKNGFIYESLCYALYQQRKNGVGKLWGISESAYLAFDGDMNYQYKAHGVQSLALTRYGDNEKILSPYSVYLTMCVAPKSALRTLVLYDRAGMLGKYGHYEAMDCSPPNKKGAPIYSYMSHHMGMSLIACANACFDGVFVNRFMNHPATSAFYELLQEKIPVGALIYEAEKQNNDRKPSVSASAFQKSIAEYNSAEPIFHVLSNGANTVVSDSFGHVRLSHGGITVNESVFDRYGNVKSLNLAFCCGDEVYYAAPVGKSGKHSFESASNYSAHICASAQFSGRVKYYTDASGCFVAETKSDGKKDYSLVFSFEPQLCTDKEFYAHPAFNRLFISAEYDKATNTLIYCKNNREGTQTTYMAVGLGDKNIPISFEVNKDGYNAFSLRSPKDFIKKKYANGTGVCVNPLCLIKTIPLQGGEARFIIALGHSKTECLERLELSRRGLTAVGSAVFGSRENPILEGIFMGRRHFLKTLKAKESALWSYGVSGDYPIIAVAVREEQFRAAEFYIGLFKSLAAMNIRVEMVFLLWEEDKYLSPLRKSLFSLLRKLKCENFMGKRGGIFFVDGSNGDTVSVFKDAAVYYCENCDSVFTDRYISPEPISPIELVERVVINSDDNGSYTEKGCTVHKSQNVALPFSYILAGKGFGSVITQSTLGYSFYGNAALCKISAFSGDAYGGTDRGEVLYAFISGKAYDLIACAEKVHYVQGTALYEGCIEGNSYSVEVFVCCRLPLKCIRVRLENEAKIAFSVIPSMGSGSKSPVKTEAINGEETAAICFTNPKSSYYSGYSGFIACHGKAQSYESKSALLGSEAPWEDTVALSVNGTQATFLLGAAPTVSGVKSLCKTFWKRGFDSEKAQAAVFARSFLPPINLKASKSLSATFNVFAPYQVAACRFYARGAFYQSGGAFGFRDQLQDCLYLVYSHPRAVRTHLLRAAARQYTEGCVQHWWHPSKREGRVYGVKTTCSDDFMWLPIAVAEYVEITGDRSILAEKVPYLSSPSLTDERERYEAAEVTDFKESIEEHCLRCFEYADRFGAHGLPLMGSCDWNDAFSMLGEGAESVFCAFLYAVAYDKFASVIGDEKLREKGRALLAKAEGAYSKDRYIRAYKGNGVPLGTEGRSACEIDALVQAFAVFAGADAKKSRLAMETAYKRLYDKENRLLMLFTPPFGTDTDYAGYINAYAKGIRENGGQYTHGAIWFAAALAKCGMVEEALELINDINPMNRYENGKLYAKYKGEPYAIAADIYTARGQKGRMGWSHYTGAAAWYCKTVLEVFMGIKLQGFSRIIKVEPLMEYEATVSYKGKLTVKAYKGAPLSYDGKTAIFPIKLEDGEHILTVPVK